MSDSNNPKMKVEFAPGAFDDFEGTQQELDEFIAEIVRIVESGEIEQLSRPVDLDSLSETERIKLEQSLDMYDGKIPSQRKLN